MFVTGDIYEPANSYDNSSFDVGPSYFIEGRVSILNRVFRERGISDIYA
jgi:hypothetical protein